MVANKTSRSAAVVIAIFSAATGVTVLVGCNSKSAVEKPSAPAAPVLSLAGNNPNDGVAAQPSNADGNGNTNAARADVPTPAEADRAEFESLVEEFKSNVMAWDAGKPFDFNPVAELISKRLRAKFDEQNFRLAHDAGMIFEMAGAYPAARQVYTALKSAASGMEGQKLADNAMLMANLGLTRLNLLGTKPQIDGTVFGGDKLDWAKYKGKVVLIDFWATWCGPCMQELPTVKKVYDKYHDQGFDIVGVTLDDDASDLEKFQKKENLPWPTLFDENPQKRGDNVPLAKAFGVNGIPATYLIDRSGKVVSISVRGEQLEAQVKKLLDEK